MKILIIGSTSQDLVPGLHPLRFKDLPVSKFGTPDNFLQLISNICKTRTSSAVIWNTIDVLEQSSLKKIQKQCQVPIFPIGPFHKVVPASSTSLLKEDTSCIIWLDKQIQNSVLYISLGSLASIDKEELDEMAWGLEQQGVQMICRPCFGDKRVNSRFISHVWGIGLELENTFAREIERAVRRLVVDKEGEEMRQKARNLKKMVELCSKDGSPNNSLNQSLLIHFDQVAGVRGMLPSPQLESNYETFEISK